MSRGSGTGGVGCVSAVVFVASGVVAGLAHWQGWPTPVFYVAAVVCVLSLLFAMASFGLLGEFLVDFLEAIASSLSDD